MGNASEGFRVPSSKETSSSDPRLRVLIVDDDEGVVELLCDILAGNNFDAVGALDGKKALEAFAKQRFDLVLLDIGLPDKDGFEVLAAIRRDSRVPVIIVSGRDQPTAKVAGLSLGADDYVSKPFDNDELVARCWSALRRAGLPTASSPFAAGDMQFDFDARRVMVSASEVILTRLEYEALKLLALNFGKVMDYDLLWLKVWGYRNEADRDSVHRLISRLKAKLQASQSSEHIVAVPGVGYRLEYRR